MLIGVVGFLVVLGLGFTELSQVTKQPSPQWRTTINYGDAK